MAMNFMGNQIYFKTDKNFVFLFPFFKTEISSTFLQRKFENTFSHSISNLAIVSYLKPHTVPQQKWIQALHEE